jgi:hypothetical protein
MANIYGYKNNYLVKTRSESSNNDFYLGFIKYVDNRPQIILFNTDIKYNPSTKTFTAHNINGLIDKVEVNNSDYNGNLKLVFSDGSNNLLDNNHLFYHPFFQQLKIEANNSQTYQLLLQNSAQSAGIQIKGQPTMSQYEANITHYQDVLKIQNTGSDTEIQQVGSGTIYIYNGNGSLTLNSSGNLVATGIYAGNGSLLTSLTTANLNGLVQNNQIQNPSIIIGNTIFNLGDTSTTITGLTSVTSDLFDGKIYIEERSDSKNYSLLFSVIPLGVDNERLINTDTNIYWNPSSSTLTCHRLDGYATGLELQTFSNIKPFVFCDGGIISTQSVYTTSSNDLCWDNNNKRLGIGNANPTKKLTIYQDIGGYGEFNLTTNSQELLFGCDTLGGRSYIQSRTIAGANNNLTLQPNGGNVGIGIANPQSTLHILGLKATVPSIRGIHLGEDSTDGNQAIELVSDTANYCYLDFTKINSDFKCRIMADVLNGTLGFHTGSTYNERISINSTGNVGIGITNPLTKLHIGNSANAVQLTIDGANAYPLAGFLIGGWTGNNDVNKHTIQSSNNLHIDSSDNGNLYMNYYSARDMFLCFGGGNVGIGNVNPTAKLHVSSADGYIQKWDSTSSNSFLYHDSTSTEIGTNSATDLILSAYSQKMTLQQGTGNLGIGLTNPTQMLHVYKVGKCIGLIQGTTDSAYTSTTTNNGTSYFGTDGVGLMDIDTGATIVASSGAKNIYIAPGLSAKMTIRPDGNVGIGLTTPSHKLDVSGKVFSNNGFYTPPFTSSGNYYFGTEYLNYILAGMEIEHTTLTGNYSQKVHFRTHHFAISNGRRMTIDENGNVGIGVINPSYQLHLSVDSAGKPNGGLWSNSSDIRIKQNVTNITKNQLFSIAKNYNTKHFKYKESYRKAHKLEDRFYFGVIANEIKEYMPCCITENELKYKIGEDEDGKDIYEVIEDCLTYNGTELQYVLLGCIPHLINENEHLKKEIDELKENQKKIIQKLNSIINPDGWFMNSI